MTRMVTSLSALILSIILLVSGNAFLMTLLGIRLSIEAISPDIIGWILVCYSIGFVLGTLYVHRIIGRVGHIRAFAVFAAAAAVTSLLYPMAVSEIFWAVLRVLSGFSIAGVLVPFSIAAILLALALMPLALTKMEAPVIEQVQRISIFTLARESFSGVAGALICGVMIGGFYALGPVYATLVGLDVARTSTFMASAIVAAMILAWPLGRLCDRFDRRRVMFWIALVAASAAGGVGVLGAGNAWLLTLLVGVFTGLSAALYPVAVAITNDRMESTRIVAASATLLLSYGVGSVIGPVVMAELINLLGPKGLFFGNAGFLLLLALITSYRISHTEDVAVADQEHFVPAMPEASPVLAEIDPRNSEFHESPEVEEMHEEQRQAS